MQLPNHPHHQLQRLTAALLIGFLAVALSLFFWNVLRASAILAREDNPRLAEAELRIQRGAIVDRNQTILAQTVGPANLLDRIYPLDAIGPAVGYYSFRHGTAGIEEGLDTLLRGDSDDFGTNLMRDILNQPQVGQNIQLTLHSEWQMMADERLPNQPSALLLLEITQTVDGPLADIAVLVSHPSYDPNQLDEAFDRLTADETAPLLNRVTQGQYQPGLLLQPLILAAALDQDAIQLTTPITGINEPLIVSGSIMRCATPPPTSTTTWQTALQHRCPAPMRPLGDQLGSSGLDQLFADFQLTQVPSLPLAIDPLPTTVTRDPLRAALGQETLTLSPLQIGLAFASLTTNGSLPTPRLLKATQSEANAPWQPFPLPIVPSETTNRETAHSEAANSETTVSPQTATAIYQALPQNNDIREYSVTVLSGPAGSTNVWYIGLAPAENPRYIAIVVVENTRDLNLVEKIGRDILVAVQK